MDEAGLRQICKRALAMNRKTFSGEEYDIAYHALMAALHCGEELNDVKFLTEIERLAREQTEYIDAHHPEYTHSSKSANTRGHINIFQAAANQARSRILFIEKKQDSKLKSGEV